jgi:hypothetical protein
VYRATQQAADNSLHHNICITLPSYQSLSPCLPVLSARLISRSIQSFISPLPGRNHTDTDRTHPQYFSHLTAFGLGNGILGVSRTSSSDILVLAPFEYDTVCIPRLWRFGRYCIVGAVLGFLSGRRVRRSPASGCRPRFGRRRRTAIRAPTTASAKRMAIIMTTSPTAFGPCESSRTAGFAGRWGGRDGDTNEREMAGREGKSISCAGTRMNPYEIGSQWNSLELDTGRTIV